MAEIFWYIVPAAYVMDVLFGDPRWLPHPVVWMGRAICFFEPLFRRLISNLLWSGALFAVFLIGSAWAVATALVALAGKVHPAASIILQVVLLFFCFSSRSLETAAMEVFKALKENNLVKARQKVGMIVGRSTDNLDEAGVTRAAVETVAENFVDGFLSPLFFALIGGAPLAIAYKMVNTLDSMVGYQNDRYILFGRAAARIDDAANFIPARLSVAILFLSALLISPARAKSAWQTGIKEGRCHKSPNAGFPEAAFAGALRIRLGGPNIYHGTRVEKPYIGARFFDPGKEKIRQACDLMTAGSFIAVCISCALSGVLSMAGQ
jgi:adenosylcobinamide-phosphate synthase